MNGTFGRLLLATSVFWVSFFSAALAQTAIEEVPTVTPEISKENLTQTSNLTSVEPEIDNSMSQVTSVSQLSDVQPTDWAFQALQSLVERYGCIEGYPDRTYRGNRAMTRYEFAAGLNACLNRISELIAASTADLVRKEDLFSLQKLQEQFANELAQLRGRIDSLENRVTQIEANQFSTTTKLVGDSIWLIGDTFGNRANNTRAPDTKDETNVFFAQRTRLDFQTSFSGKDLLSTRLQINNIPNLAATTGTNMTRIGPDSPNNDTQVRLDRLMYRFAVGKAVIFIGPKGLSLDTLAPTINPLFDTAISAGVSAFGLRNPTVYRAFDGAGAGIAYPLSSQFRVNLGYIADAGQAPNPADSRGLFNGSFAAIGQLTFSPSRQLDLGLTYTRKYFTTGSVGVTSGTGSFFANRPFGQNPTTSDNFGFQFTWRLTPKFNLGGWFGYTIAHQVKGEENEATILNGAINFGFPDLFVKGNLGGVIVGVPPKVTSNDFLVNGKQAEDPDTSLHIEAFYRYRINNNISVTPIVYVITKPDHNDVNQPIWVGILRTSFTF
ncbi:iron uptake porin [Floridanema aerugineum]|uniref:Iron uptake porin n=1 Tax=Floridaenema aerugineum BLCC-F46 TaxID=3153654 RepID=A0ABV4XDV3_9CYAN